MERDHFFKKEERLSLLKRPRVSGRAEEELEEKGNACDEDVYNVGRVWQGEEQTSVADDLFKMQSSTELRCG